jgi:hypothetical protein
MTLTRVAERPVRQSGWATGIGGAVAGIAEAVALMPRRVDLWT